MQNASIAVGSTVTVSGVVTAATDRGAFVQEPAGGQYSGVLVWFDGNGPATVPAVDVTVDVTGVVEEYMDSGSTDTITRINIAAGTWTETGTGTVTAEVLSPTAIIAASEPWEGVLVTLDNTDPLVVTNASLGFGEWSVDDVRVDDLYFDWIGTNGLNDGDSFDTVTGVWNYTFDNYKLEPRAEVDFTGYAAQVFPADSIPVGEIIVTELMSNPTCAGDDCEWIEVYNTGTATHNLRGMKVVDDGDNIASIGTDVMIAPGEFKVLAKGTVADWTYTMFTPDGYFNSGDLPHLNNSGDTIYLRNASGDISQSLTWPNSTSGSSWQLSSDEFNATSATDVGMWCIATTSMEAGEFGTPGAANIVCP